jgi:NCS2 family nucleobase:cation symporter-2
MTSRMLDARKILVMGMAVQAGLAVEAFPSFFHSAPIWAQPIVGSALVAGTLVAIALNLLFRIGIRKVATLSVDPRHFSTSTVSDFMQDQGAAWAARRDVVNRATFGAVQLLELLGAVPGDIELEARFDEFNLDVLVRYTGSPLEFPERRPSAREIIASAEGERLLAGHLLRRSADRISSRAVGEQAEVHLHYDH